MGCLNDYCHKCKARLPEMRGWICEKCEFWERMERIVALMALGYATEAASIMQLMTIGEQILAWHLLEGIEAGC